MSGELKGVGVGLGKTHVFIRNFTLPAPERMRVKGLVGRDVVEAGVRYQDPSEQEDPKRGFARKVVGGIKCEKSLGHDIISMEALEVEVTKRMMWRLLGGVGENSVFT